MMVPFVTEYRGCLFYHFKSKSRRDTLTRPNGTDFTARSAISPFTRLGETNFTQISASAIVLAIFSAFSEREPSSQLTMKSAYFS